MTDELSARKSAASKTLAADFTIQPQLRLVSGLC
jgi:hypothetical protein